VLADQVVPFGRTDVTVSRLGLGTAWLGNLYQEVGDADADDVVARSFQLGLRLIDTAPYYGLGLAERRLGRALAGRSRDDFVLSTKVGRMLRARTPTDPPLVHEGGPLFPGAPDLHTYFDFSYDATLRSVEDSLARLGVDRLDITLVHDPDDHFTDAMSGALPALLRLRDEGVVRAVGVGMNQPEMLTEFARRSDVDCLLIAGHYTLLDQTAHAALLPVCADRGIALLVGGVFNTGFLAAPAERAIYNYLPAPQEITHRASQISLVCQRHGTTLRAAALAFPFGHPAVTCALIGVRTSDELQQDAELLAAPPPADFWQDLRLQRLLPPEVPVPGS
jgi:D-threo-aldose 1-dehydrogenase